MADDDERSGHHGRRARTLVPSRRSRRARAIVEHMPTGLLVLRGSRTGKAFRVVDANTAAAELTGASGGIVGRTASDLFSGPDEDPLAVGRRLAGVLRSGLPARLDSIRVTTPACTGRLFSLHAFVVGRATIGVSLEDVTDRLATAAALVHQASHDALTGLPNRALFTERLRRALTESRRNGQPVSLLLMDLDQFKEINDSLGHHHGDRLLAAVAARLRDNLRECDTIARLGGDEFAVLLTDGSGLAGARAAAHKLGRAVAEPFEVDGMTLATRGSVGIAVFPEHGTDGEMLMRHADAAMYEAKRSGGGFCVFDPVNGSANLERLALAAELRRAIDLGQLRLVYQPILEVSTRRIVRAEALVRWQHPRLGLLPPSEFLDLAELSGTIRPLTMWVIDTALAQSAQWLRMGVDLAVSVNLSPRTLSEPRLALQLASRLTALGLEGSKLTVEIGENELTHEPTAAMAMISRLRALGVRTSLDDFGTGRSSLGSLQGVPISEIKVDGSFVGRLDHNDDGALRVVRSIVDLGRNLGVDVVAEGVESADALRQVREIGCRFAQGYHIGPPMSAGAIALVAAATQSTPAMIDVRDDG